MELQSPFRVVTPSVDGDVLAALAGADQEFTLARIHALAPERSRAGLRLATLRLVDQGIVLERQEGRVGLYRLNRQHLAAPAVLAIAGLRADLLRRITERIAAWSVKPVYVALFGSAARGQMRPDSDLDLFLLDPDYGDEAMAAERDALVQQVAIWTGNDPRLLILTVDDVAGPRRDERVLDEIARDGVPIYGDVDALRQLRRGVAP